MIASRILDAGWLFVAIRSTMKASVSPISLSVVFVPIAVAGRAGRQFLRLRTVYGHEVPQLVSAQEAKQKK